MKQFKCEICGGTSIIQIDERTYECQDCGLQYDIAEVEKLIVLPQEVVEEPVELTVEEQEDLQPTFDVAQELEDNFTEEVEAEQETEEIAVETDSEKSPEYIEDTLIESAESEENDNSIAIEESQFEVFEETADEISIVEPEIEEAEDVVSEDEDKSEETEVYEQEETVESNAIIPWYKNKKIIIPSIAGIALALVVVILLIVLLPKGNVPVLDDNSSDIKSTVESSQVESTQEPSESNVESREEETSKQTANSSTENSSIHGSSTSNSPLPPGTIKNEDGTYVYRHYHENGNLSSEIVYYNNYNVKCSTFYSENGIKERESYYNTDGTQAKDVSYENGVVLLVSDWNKDEIIHYSYNENGKLFCVSTSNISNGKEKHLSYYFEDGTVEQESFYNENEQMIKFIDYKYGKVSKIICTYFANGNRCTYEHFENDVLTYREECYENGRSKLVLDYDNSGNILRERHYDENGNLIYDKHDGN